MVALKKRIRKRLEKQNLPTTIFLLITIVSVGLIVLPMWNYVDFYVALGDFSVTVPSVTISTIQINDYLHAQAKVNVTLAASNPTGYSGLKLSSVICQLYFFNSNNQLVLLASARNNTWTPINPNSNRKILFKFSFSASNPNDPAGSSFIIYLESAFAAGIKQITGYVSFNVFLSSFLANPEIIKGSPYVTSLS